MAKIALVTGELTESMLKAGKSLLRKLDSSQSDVRSAFWIYQPTLGIWKLVLASDKVDVEGPRNFYKRIIKANNSAKKDNYILSLSDISVTNMSNRLVGLFGMLFSTPNDQIGGMRLTRNTINGIFIEDVYIYRSRRQDNIGQGAATVPREND